MNNQVLITQSGLDSLKAELSQLQTTKRPATVDRLSLARSQGDLSENSDYQNAKEELEFLDGRIDELEESIRNAKVAVPASADTIDFGHKVKVQLNSSESEFQIVGEPEADPKSRKISYQSPLGLALMGKKVGDRVEVSAPVGNITYQILEIK